MVEQLSTYIPIFCYESFVDFILYLLYVIKNYSIDSVCWQPCPDVYWFPLMKPRFCKEFIEIMEAYGEWSDGTNKVSSVSGRKVNIVYSNSCTVHHILLK